MEDEKICLRCKRRIKIHCKGLCKSCYNHKILNREKQSGYNKKWRKKNPNYFKEYYLNYKSFKDE